MQIPRFVRRCVSLLFVAFPLSIAVPLTPSAFAQTTAGSLDAGFTLGDGFGVGGFSRGVFSVTQESDGKVLLGGTLLSINEVAVGPFVRVNTDGSLDTSFKRPVIESYDTRTDDTITTLNPDFLPVVEIVAPQADGKILVGGNFYFVNGVSGYGGLIRCNSDGTLDTSFTAVRFAGTVYTVAPTSDGGYLVGGDFTSAGDVQKTCLARLKANGKLDTTFDAGIFSGTLASGGGPLNVHALVIQADGKVVIGGSFSQIRGIAHPGLARLNKDGTLDNTYVVDPNFNPTGSAGNSANGVQTIVLLPDGTTLVGGTFLDPNISGKARNSLFHLNTSGGIEAAFNPGGTGTDGTVDAAVLQADGKILIGGGFTHYNGVARNSLARLLADGTLDATFDPGVGPEAEVFTLHLQSDGKLLLGGYFIFIDNVPADLVARVNTEAGVAPAVTVSVITTANPAKVGTPSTKGFFTVSRVGGNTTVALNVRYTLSGSAQNGVDYRALSGTVTIPAGSLSAGIKIKPRENPDEQRKHDVVITLSPSSAYATGFNTATVKIVNPMVP